MGAMALSITSLVALILPAFLHWRRASQKAALDNKLKSIARDNANMEAEDHELQQILHPEA